MKREKSCGALVYRTSGRGVELLLLKHKYGGHWSFPKGHVEAGETEIQTALREVKEETGLTVSLHEGFRHAVEYFPKPNVKKQVVYFLGYAADDHVVKQEEEISEIQWVPLEKADTIVTFKNDKNLIHRAIASLADGQGPQ
ncbi:MAG: NUDIX domain-containing protein [Oscillospiraceae bacterium]|nr:NUDIX domain-containing protein [Oscillospiraceae bacterium]